ncbi:hypothetical protein VHEMI04693 [[Torrubiella] hemipterigena]|uniref:Uncharacterized protein n=1 Tax=[Torrubiella] hemipterigena TaxID=1531966 RepID=A0A0A1TF32_9HYPO|nr:hypothetical protein VHEMI04693 [[Torrubiella] hemipterigena]
MPPDSPIERCRSQQLPRKALSLLALPHEVLCLICAQLCPHCRGVDPEEQFSATWAEIQAPHAVSQTCTTLRNIAQPLLYHLPNILNLNSFLRTIRARRDLSECVKWFPYNNIYTELVVQCFKDDGFALIKDMAAELQMLTPQDKPFEEQFADMFVYLANGSDYDQSPHGCLFQLEQFKTLLHAILVASFSRVEVLRIPSWQDSEKFEPVLNKFARRRLQRVGRMVSDRCARSSMSSLHTVIIDDWRESCWHWEHEDGHSYVEENNIHLDPRELLFGCATSLKQIIFYRCDAPYLWPADSGGANPRTIWSDLPDLRAVEFSKMAWGASECYADAPERPVTQEQQDVAYARIEQMVTECSKLTSFKMSTICIDYPRFYNTFSLHRLLQSLLVAASRLETFEINTEHIRYRAGSTATLAADFSCFPKLQRLSFDEECICQHWTYGIYNDQYDPLNPCDEGEEYPPVCRNNHCLVDMLPPVASLNIQLAPNPRIIPDILQLEKAVREGRFPNLKHLTLETCLRIPKAKLRQSLESYERNEIHHSHRQDFYRNIEAQPKMQALVPTIEEAFRGSSVFVEVLVIPRFS